MPFHASPPRRVPQFRKEGVAGPEAIEDAEFVNLEQTGMRHSGGFAHGVYAILPDKHFYDKLRFLFGGVDAGGATGATVAVYARVTPGEERLVGRSELTANGSFEPIEIENYQAVYAVVVEGVEAGALTFDVSVQGAYENA